MNTIEATVGGDEMVASAQIFAEEVKKGKEKKGEYRVIHNVAHLNYGVMEKNQTIKKNKVGENTSFVNWENDFSNLVYNGEGSNRCFNTPYSYLSLWGGSKKIRLSSLGEPFELASGGQVWDEVVRRGFDDLCAERIVYDQRDPGTDELKYSIRLCGFDSRDGSMIVQPALYTQQARSNLISDYKFVRSAMQAAPYPSLRELISMEFPGRLPPLHDRRLANTVGVSVLILCRDDDGNRRPLFHIRAGGNQAMADRGVQCTGTCAAFWPSTKQSMSAENFFEDEAWRAIETDYGLTRSAIPGGLHMMGLLREYARMGKPQIFYYGETSFSLDQIVRMRIERQSNFVGQKRGVQLPADKYEYTTRDQFKDFLTKRLWTEETLREVPFTHEAASMLTVLLREFGSYASA